MNKNQYALNIIINCFLEYPVGKETTNTELMSSLFWENHIIGQQVRVLANKHRVLN
jgi:hypothetical protein